MRKVTNEILLSVSPQRALDAFTELELMRGWWGVERCLVEKQPGGSYALSWGVSEHGFHYVSCGVVQDYRPGELLQVGHMCYFNPERAILGGMSMTLRTSRQGDQTRLQVIQDGYRHGGDWDWYYEAVVEAWPQALQHLKGYLENSSPNQ